MLHLPVFQRLSGCLLAFFDFTPHIDPSLTRGPSLDPSINSGTAGSAHRLASRFDETLRDAYPEEMVEIDNYHFLPFLVDRKDAVSYPDGLKARPEVQLFFRYSRGDIPIAFLNWFVK